MEDLSQHVNTIEHEAPRTPEQERISTLETELAESRRRTGEAVGRLEQFKQSVRRTVIERIKDGTICRPGADDALEGWDLEPYDPLYNVRLSLDLEITVEADGEDDAREKAENAIYIETGDYDHYLNDTYVNSVEEVED